MERRETLAALFALAIGVPAAAQAQKQPRSRPAVVGLLANGSPRPRLPAPVASLLSALRDLGYAEGSTVRVEMRWAENDPARLPDLAEDLVRTGVDVIVASGDNAIRAAMAATRTIPIVMASSGDAVGAGFVASLARPGGNVTGMTAINPELGAKRVQLMKEILPVTSRIGVLWNLRDPAHVLDLKEIQSASAVLKVVIRPVGIRTPGDVAGAFSSFAADKVHAVIVFSDSLMIAAREEIIGQATRRRLAAMYEASEWAELGGLVSYGVTHADLFRRSATHVDRILRGASAADLPVEQPVSFRLTVSLKAARAIGMDVPGSVLQRADRVIE